MPIIVDRLAKGRSAPKHPPCSPEFFSSFHLLFPSPLLPRPRPSHAELGTVWREESRGFSTGQQCRNAPPISDQQRRVRATLFSIQHGTRRRGGCRQGSGRVQFDGNQALWGALKRAADSMIMASGPASDGREAKADTTTGGANQPRTLRGHRAIASTLQERGECVVHPPYTHARGTASHLQGTM